VARGFSGWLAATLLVAIATAPLSGILEAATGSLKLFENPIDPSTASYFRLLLVMAVTKQY
jgi:hypothetical protein